MRPRPFRPVAVAGLLAVGLAAALPAAAETRHDIGSDPGCNVRTPYALRVDADALRLSADDDGLRPREVEIGDGGLRLDGVAQALSAADAERMRGIESGTRALLPDIAAIARESIHIGFDALGGVNAAIGGKRQAREFERVRRRALARVDRAMDSGTWSPDLLGEALEADIEAAAEAAASGFTPTRALWMAFTGGIGRMERRLEKMEAGLERDIAAREATLEAHATSLCSGLGRLDALQDALELRLEDGRPLRLFELEHGRGDTAGDDDLRASAR